MTGAHYFLIHISALILPGWLIMRATNLSIWNAIFIPASAFIYYVLLAVIAKWGALPLNGFIALYIGLLFPLGFIVFRSRTRYQAKPLDLNWLIGLGVVVAVYSLYRYLAGPYSEIPADLYRHFEYARIELDALSKHQLGTSHDITALLKQHGKIWYSFYALITHLTGLEFNQTYAWATFANGLVFLGSVYSFAWYLFKFTDISSKARLFSALLATFFIAAQLGTSVFSYLRYYAIAPTMLNMVVFFAAMVALIELLKWQANQLKLFIFLVLGIITTAAVHTQETLYIFIFMVLLLAWFAVFSPYGDFTKARYHIQRTKRYYWLFLVLFVVGFAALEAWVYTHNARPTQLFDKVIQLSEQGPILNRIFYLNPSYQAYQVITLWGLAVYGLFFIYWRRFLSQPYLFAGMLVPFATVFNPLFVDWFLRLGGVNTLWRMLYIVPMHFVAALLVVYLFESAKIKAKQFISIVPYTGILLLFILLLPINGINPNSRLTLMPTQADAGYTHWQDLIDYLNQDNLKAGSILTDPVTGYVLLGLTKHRTYQYKFLNLNMRKINFTHYDKSPLQRYKNWLLVVNDRNGGLSESGAVSRHWPTDVLHTESFYSPALREHINANPDQRFKLLWQKNKISVYKILPLK